MGGAQDRLPSFLHPSPSGVAAPFPGPRAQHLLHPASSQTFLFHIYGLILRESADKELVRRHLADLLELSHQSANQREVGPQPTAPRVPAAPSAVLRNMGPPGHRCGPRRPQGPARSGVLALSCPDALQGLPLQGPREEWAGGSKHIPRGLGGADSRGPPARRALLLPSASCLPRTCRPSGPRWSTWAAPGSCGPPSCPQTAR